MKDFWKSLQIHPTLNDEANRVYRNFNYLLLIGIADVAFLCVFFRNVNPNWPFLVCAIELVCLVALLDLHRKGLFHTARYLTFLLVITIQITASLVHGKSAGFDYIFLAIAVLPMLFFSSPKSYISLFIISMASLLAIQYFFKVLKPSILLEGDGVYYWNIFLTGAIIFLTLYFFKTGYEKKHAQLTRQNEAIHNQKEEIEQINEELESIINDNTEKLRTQEERINEYAHIHAHQVRSPLARIMGLIHLVDLETDSEKALREYLPKIKSNADELNTQLKEVSKHLNNMDAEKGESA
jgi:signal transduction histidine kinase